MVMEKFNFFKNSRWGATTKNWKILANRKKIGDLYELDNFKQKNFKIEITNVIFRSIFNENENIFWLCKLKLKSELDTSET